MSERFDFEKQPESENQLENQARLFQQAPLPPAGELSEDGGVWMEQEGLLSPKVSLKDNPFLYNPNVSLT